MEIERTLNADIPGSVSELQAMMKQFLLKHKLYRILLRGKGLEFEAYRKYAQDDDANAIDWKASLRSNSILVKQYKEEKNLKIVFIVDVGENMVFGSSPKLKCEYAAEVVGSFSHLITTSGDKAGLAIYSDTLKSYIKPSSGNRHFHLVVDQLMKAENYGNLSNVDRALEFALEYLGPNIDSVVIISDFISFNRKHIRDLSSLPQKFETILLSVRDPLDNTFPEIKGEVVLEDPRTGEQILVNPELAKQAYEKFAKDQLDLLEQTCKLNGIDYLKLQTNQPFVPTLAEFLQARIRQKEGR